MDLANAGSFNFFLVLNPAFARILGSFTTEQINVVKLRPTLRHGISNVVSIKVDKYQMLDSGARNS